MNVGGPFVLIAALALWFPLTAKAGPISDLTMADHGKQANRATAHPNHALTTPDLLVLAALDDNGWHLGWFKSRVQTPSADEDFILAPPSGPLRSSELPSTVLDPAGAAGVIPFELLVDAPTVVNPERNTLQATSVPQPVPEPTTILLVAGGLLAAARRKFRR